MLRLPTGIAAVALVLAGLGWSGCSSDADTPLGSEFYSDGILGSRPGEVFAETLTVAAGDTSVHVSSLVSHDQWLSLSVSSRYRSTILLRFDLSAGAADSGKAVRRADIRLRLGEQSKDLVMPARFYRLSAPFAEGDTLLELSLLPNPIPDGSGVNVEREMKLVGDYSLPPSLVEDWLAGVQEHRGIAIVPQIADTTLELQFGAGENQDDGLHPFLDVGFEDGSSGFYPIADDATFYDTLSTSTNLVLSDGYARRVFLPVDLGGVRSDAIIHSAELELSLAPVLVEGTDLMVELYAPGSSNPSDPGFLEGQKVTEVVVTPGAGSLLLPVRNILLFFLAGTVPNNGLVLKFGSEGSDLRHIEFYSSSASAEKRPRLRIVYSSAPDFGEVGK